MAPVTTPAILLRAHDYGDSSRILRFYTEGFGMVSVMGHGVRGRAGKGAATIASYASGHLTAYVKTHRDLHTMKDFTCTRVRAGLGQHVLRFAGASAVAELVLAHAEHDPHLSLYQVLEAALDRLELVDESDVPAAVLAGLWTIVQALGFSPQLDACVACGQRLIDQGGGRFDFSAGGVRCRTCAEGATGPLVGPRARGQLGLLLDGGLPPGLTHTRQHFRLVSDFVAYHVVARPLKSFEFLSEMLPEDAGSPS